jgi:hypothetical protein
MVIPATDTLKNTAIKPAATRQTPSSRRNQRLAIG